MSKFKYSLLGDSRAKLSLPINYNKSHWKVRKQAREQYCMELRKNKGEEVKV